MQSQEHLLYASNVSWTTYVGLEVKIGTLRNFTFCRIFGYPGYHDVYLNFVSLILTDIFERLNVFNRKYLNFLISQYWYLN